MIENHIVNDYIEWKELEEFHLKLNIDEYLWFSRSFSKYIKFTRINKSIENKISFYCIVKHYIGIISLPDGRIIRIKPKFLGTKFIEMLLKSDPNLAKFFPETINNFKKPDFFDFINDLIQKFLNLSEKIIFYNFRKSYQTIITQNQQIRGKILVSNSINSSHFFNGQLIMTIDEPSLNNIDNQLIKYVLRKLYPLMTKRNKKKINKLLRKMLDVNNFAFHLKDRIKFRYNKQNIHYISCHNLCWLFIEKFLIGGFNGSFTSQSFLFNSWNIYEKFLIKLFEKNFLDCEVKKGKILMKKKIKSTIIRDSKKIPDIILEKNNEILLIADAKYKEKYDFRNDAGQMLRYLRAFIKIDELGSKKFSKKKRNALLIYPKNSNDNSDLKFILYDTPDENLGSIYYIRIDLTKIDDENYIQNWLGSIKSNLNLKFY